MSEQEMLMTGAGPATKTVPPQEMPEAKVAADGSEWVDTRFGKVKVYRQSPIVFPNGLLGMPDKFEYCLTQFPNEKLGRFKLLQSLDDAKLSFITLPVDADNPIIERADIAVACKDLEMSENEVTLLLIVTVHRSTEGVKLSVNARAPIFINTPRRVATQYVFHNPKYDIQHMITL